MHKISLEEAKTRIGIGALWAHFGFVGGPKTSCRCPWREDRNPSFSVSTDGLLWHDFATGEGGDAIDFLARASGLNQGDACRKFVELAGGCSAAPSSTQAPPGRERPTFPQFEKGGMAELRQLAKLRNIGLEGLQFANERGLLWFATLRGFSAWIVTDGQRLNAQARRMDGQSWEHINGHPKAWTLAGSFASWPIGIMEARTFPAIAVCEGGPDFLAAHYLALWEQSSHHAKRDVQCSPVAILGASQRIHRDAVALFAGKIVRIFGHDDEAGRKAVLHWAGQLRAVSAKVDEFRFAGLRQVDGKPVKDLNDSLSMSVESFRDAGRMLP